MDTATQIKPRHQVAGHLSTLVRSLGTVDYLHERHPLDTRGCCTVCWTEPRRWWRPWPRRSTCSACSASSFFLRRPL